MKAATLRRLHRWLGFFSLSKKWKDTTCIGFHWRSLWASMKKTGE
jgi:hypothetical protein